MVFRTLARKTVPTFRPSHESAPRQKKTMLWTLLPVAWPTICPLSHQLVAGPLYRRRQSAGPHQYRGCRRSTSTSSANGTAFTHHLQSIRTTPGNLQVFRTTIPFKFRTIIDMRNNYEIIGRACPKKPVWRNSQTVIGLVNKLKKEGENQEGHYAVGVQRKYVCKRSG